MLTVYTEATQKDVIFHNDAFFNLHVNVQMITSEVLKYVWKIDQAKLTPTGKITTKYGIGTLHDLSTGCKTLINILCFPEHIFSVNECGGNVLSEIFLLNDREIYMSRPYTFAIPDDKQICMNNHDIVNGSSEWGAWWSAEYERRL